MLTPVNEILCIEYAVLVKNMTYLLVNIFVMDLTLKTIKQNRKKFPEMGLPTVSLLFSGTHMNNPDNTDY